MSDAGPDLTLYAESSWMSPWVFHAMIALEEKQLPYKLQVVSLPLGELARGALQARALIATVPVLVHASAGVALSESLAISEYLDEVFPSPAILPEAPAQRARARQLMLYLRTQLHALREARPTSSVFGRPIARPMPDKARTEAAELERIALAVVPEDGGPLFGAWSVADADLALALMRLVAHQEVSDRRLVSYAMAQFDRKSVRRFVAHLPTSR